MMVFKHSQAIKEEALATSVIGDLGRKYGRSNREVWGEDYASENLTFWGE